jgi:predicted aconitase with swiveling domain
VCRTAISFLGGVDPVTGRIADPECEERGSSVSGKVLCFPYGKGSTVGSYSMYQLRLNGKAPKAVVNASAEPIVATGAIISGIPMVDRVDISLLRSSDRLTVDGDAGTVELHGVEERQVVTSVLRNRGQVLILRRSGDVGSFKGKWACVSGFVERDESDLDAAKREVLEETGVRRPKLAGSIPVERFRDGRFVWTVHPFLFDIPRRDVRLDWEHDESMWVRPEELGSYDCVPGLRSVVDRLLKPEC